MTQRSLAELVEAARGGDASAYEELYRQTANQMMGLALSMLKHEQDELDVLQDSYLYAFRAGEAGCVLRLALPAGG